MARGCAIVAVWVGLALAACGGHRGPEYDRPPVLANRQEIADAIRGLGGEPVEAEITLLVHVDQQGRVRDARIREGSGDEDLDAAVLWLAERMRFEPATKSGDPVHAWITLPLKIDVVAPGARPAKLRNGDAVAGLIFRRYPDLRGRAVLRVRVDVEGRVAEVRTRDGTVAQAATAARELAEELRFRPAFKGFEARATWVEVTFVFDGSRSEVRVESSD